MSSVSFSSDKKFRDDKYFPYGFARSGVFNRDQSDLIERHGRAYVSLANGERQPLCGLEDSFVQFCRGAKGAETVHEKTWHLYQQEIARKSAKPMSLGCDVGEEDYSEELDDLDA